MDLGLRNAIVLVTGGSKGIGFACAQAFLDEGARVAIASRAQANLDRALNDLSGAVGFAADCADGRAALSLIDAVEAQLGPIDVLVNSAGRRAPNPAARPDTRRLAGRVRREILFLYQCDRSLGEAHGGAGPRSRRQHHRGGGKVASPTHLAGGSANAALMLATAGFGAAYAASGVRIVGVSPGLTETERVAEGLSADARLAGIDIEDARRRAVAKIPLGRAASPREIAEVVVFLASARASYVTGATLSMDGAQNPVVL